MTQTSLISYFLDGIFKTTPNKSITLYDLYNEIKSTKHAAQCEMIRALNNDNKILLKKERNVLKNKLPYVTVSGTFIKRDSNKDSLVALSGYIAIDLDCISTQEELLKFKDQFKQDPYILCCFVSPSGEGLKLIVEIPKNLENFKKYIEAFYSYLNKVYNVPLESLDDKTKDISRACYLSYDPTCYLKEQSQIFGDDEVKQYWIESKKSKSKDTSRSGEDYRQVLRRIYIGKSKDEIFYEMMQFSKWKESNDQYREHTYNNALEWYENHEPETEDKQNMINDLYSYFMANYKIYTTKEENKSEMYIYQDGIYVNNGRVYICEIINNKIGKCYTKVISQKVIDKIEPSTYIIPEELFKEEDPKYICVKNGILNLFTKELIKFDPKYRFFNKLPIEYNKDAQATNTIQHYKTVLYEQDINLMQELYGYLLYRDYKYEKAFIFSGDGGNGKGKSVEQIKNFLGINNVSAIDLQTLEENGFLVSSLHKKLANLAADIGKTKITETRNFKQATGHDTIEANRKNLSTVKFTNYAKMIFNANEIPEIEDKSEGFWRRWIIIRFDVIFKGETEYNKLEAEGKLLPKHRKADTSIIEKLSSPIELSGVLNWALDGFERLIKQGDFSYSKSETETKKSMKKYGSTVMRFFTDECIKVTDRTIYEEHNDLFEHYLNYCLRKNLTPTTSIIFKKQLSEEAPCNRVKAASEYEYRWIYIKHIGGN